MPYDAKIILDSVAPCGRRLTTFELTYPRFVHSEFMTHRLFSRNAASSRAVPVEKMLEAVESDPVLPVWWGKAQKGMQAREELTGAELHFAQEHWRVSREDCLYAATRMSACGLHKQIANRVLEPWSWITTVVSATHWNNFWSLRRHEDAQPEFKKIADMAGDLFQANTPEPLEEGEWHLPYVRNYDRHALQHQGFSQNELCLISAGRCASVSYLKHEEHDPFGIKDLARAERMLTGAHWSPFEHQAMAQSEETMRRDVLQRAMYWIEKDVPVGNFIGWQQYRKTFVGESEFAG